MAKGIRTALYLSTCVMVFSGYLALATTPEYGPSILLLPAIFFAFVPLAEWLDGRFRGYRWITSGFTYLYTLGIPIAWYSRGLFPTVVGLVIYIQAYKLLHRKNTHDYYHVFLMSFFLLVAACVLSPDASVAVPILTFLISAVWSFFTLQVQGESERCTAPSETDLVPLRLPRPVYATRRERFLDSGLLASYMAITLACILMTALFFVATPRMEAGVFGGASIQPVRQVTGLSDRVDLSYEGAIEQDTSAVMRVSGLELRDADGNPLGQYTGPLYWRVTSFDRFNGKGWDNTSESANFDDSLAYARVTMGPRFLQRVPYGDGPFVHQVIYLDKIPAKGLPALPWAWRVNWKEGRFQWDAGKGDTTFDVITAPRSSLLYTVYSEVYEPSPDTLRTARRDYTGLNADHQRIVGRSTYERLTRHDLAPDIQEIAREITQEHDNIYDKALAVQQFLQGNGFVYSLNSPLPADGNPVNHFVRTSRRGHCELFASAMALMLRSLGIPARVAAGYRGGDWDAGDQSYTVRNSMAHLWVEVYFIDHGWVRFDPSPPDSSSPDVQESVQQYFNAKVLKGKMFWYQNVVGYSSRIPMRALQSFTLGLFQSLFPTGDKPAAIEDPDDSAAPTLLIRRDLASGILLFGVIAFGFTVVLRQRRQGTARSRKSLLSRDQLRAIRLFRSVRRRIRRRVPEWEGKTAEELTREIAQADGVHSQTVRDILEAYNATRFGGRPMTRAQFQELSKAARALS